MSFVNNPAEEKIKMMESQDPEVLKFYGQDQAHLEFTLDVFALMNAEKVDPDRMKAAIQMQYIAPPRNTLLSYFVMTEFVFKYMMQTTVMAMKQSEMYKKDPKKVRDDIVRHLELLHSDALSKIDDMLENDFKFITTEDDEENETV